MNLSDALLNAKKYIHEPKYYPKEKMWGYEKYAPGYGWTAYFCITEEACWESFYKQFRAIKESLLKGKEKTK